MGAVDAGVRTADHDAGAGDAQLRPDPVGADHADVPLRAGRRGRVAAAAPGRRGQRSQPLADQHPGHLRPAGQPGPHRRPAVHLDRVDQVVRRRGRGAAGSGPGAGRPGCARRWPPAGGRPRRPGRPGRPDRAYRRGSPERSACSRSTTNSRSPCRPGWPAADVHHADGEQQDGGARPRRPAGSGCAPRAGRAARRTRWPRTTATASPTPAATATQNGTSRVVASRSEISSGSVKASGPNTARPTSQRTGAEPAGRAGPAGPPPGSARQHETDRRDEQQRGELGTGVAGARRRAAAGHPGDQAADQHGRAGPGRPVAGEGDQNRSPSSAPASRPTAAAASAASTVSSRPPSAPNQTQGSSRASPAAIASRVTARGRRAPSAAAGGVGGGGRGCGGGAAGVVAVAGGAGQPGGQQREQGRRPGQRGEVQLVVHLGKRP